MNRSQCVTVDEITSNTCPHGSILKPLLYSPSISKTFLMCEVLRFFKCRMFAEDVKEIRLTYRVWMILWRSTVKTIVYQMTWRFKYKCSHLQEIMLWSPNFISESFMRLIINTWNLWWCIFQLLFSCHRFVYKIRRRTSISKYFQRFLKSSLKTLKYRTGISVHKIVLIRQHIYVIVL